MAKNVFENIPMEDLIGSSLQEAIESQAKRAEEAVDFDSRIEVGFEVVGTQNECAAEMKQETKGEEEKRTVE